MSTLAAGNLLDALFPELLGYAVQILFRETDMMQAGAVGFQKVMEYAFPLQRFNHLELKFTEVPEGHLYFEISWLAVIECFRLDIFRGIIDHFKSIQPQ